MKLTILLLTVGFLHVHANVNSQNVSFKGTNVKLEKIFTAVKKQTGYFFFYNDVLLQNAKPVTVDADNIPLKEFLEKILSDQNLDYSIEDKSVIISKKQPTRESSHGISSPLLESPPITVRGRIVNEKGEPVIASVIIKGTKQGTSSDVNGFFELAGVDGKATLVISGANINEREIMVDGKVELNISVAAKIVTEEEVIINKGYYTEKKKLSTGSVATLSAKDIDNQPVLNPLQAMQGRLAGVYVMQQSGVPGAGFSISIRGKNSLRADGNEPLYVVDGVPYTNTSIGSGAGSGIIGLVSPFNNIDPNSIESIEVLKDADATAIYGSQGANGVVLIMTKKGKAGKTRINGGFSYGMAQVPHRISLLNTQQFIEMRKEAYANDSITTYPVTAYDINGTWDQTRYTDWQKVLIGGTARMTNADISVSGGSLNTRFLVGGSYVKQTTVYPGDFSYQRGAAHFNFSHSSENKKFQLALTTNFSADKNDLPANDLIVQAIQLAPNAPGLYMDNGDLNWENSTWNNPLGQLLKKYKANTQGLFSNMTLSYEIIKGLRLKANLGYNNLQMKELSTNPKKSLPPSIANTPSNIFSSFGNSGTNTWIIEPQIEFTKKVWMGDFTAFAATTFRGSNQNIENTQGIGYTTDALIENLKAAPIINPVTWSSSQYRYNAVYGRINYNIDQKYIINLTARRDGSSRFGSSKQFANFGAIGAAWIFSNESFFNNASKLLSYGKLRSSYGTAGSDQIGDYQYLESYSSTVSYTGTGTSLVPTRIANPYYAWEVNRKLEIALELGFVKDRIKVGINWYSNRSSNQLVGQSIPAMTGFTSYQSNLAATVLNQGWEFDISTINILTGFLKWSSSINLTIPTNKLLSYPGIENSSNAYVYEVYKSIFQTKRIHYLGVNPVTGIYQFEDKDKNDYPFDDTDKQALIKMGQTIYGGLLNTLTWRDFDLNIFIQFTRQKSNNYLASTAFDPPGMGSNEPYFVMERWTKTGQNTSISKFTTSYSTAAGAAFINGIRRYPGSDNTISDASFMRLQNIAFEWHVPQSILKKSSLASASLYIQGQNLFTLTNYYGFDPQTASFTTLPTLRVITVGAKISL